MLESSEFDDNLKILSPVLNLGLPLTFESGIAKTPDTCPAPSVIKSPPSDPPVGVIYRVILVLSKNG